MIMPCVGIFSPIVMDTTSSSSANQINTCKSIDFCLPEINSPSPHALENSDHMGSGHRTNSKSNNNNTSDIHSSSKAQKFSPDLSQLAYPMVSTPQPPPLDLSNIPNSPNKSHTPDYLDVSSGKIQNSPRTIDSFQINTTTLTTTTTVTATTNSTVNINHDTSISDKSRVKCEVNSTSHDLNPTIPTMEKLVNVDWIETLKQYAESQTMIQANTNASNINNEIDMTRISEYNNNNRPNNEPLNLNSHTTTGDFTARFQAMLTNLSEFLFNSPQVANLAKNPTVDNLNFLSPSSTTSANVLSSTFSISEMNSNKLKSDDRSQQPTNLLNSAYPNNFIDNETGFNLFNGPDLSSTNPSLVITASLLGLLASGQKPTPLPEQVVSQSSTYSKCSVSSPKSSYQSSGVYPQSFLGNASIFPHQPPTSQVQPPRFLKPSVSLQHTSVHSSLGPHSSLAPTSCALADPPNLNEPKLSDPRDLLYQLGQQLMAMATSGINGTRQNFDLWNTNNTNINYNPMGLTSLNNPPNSAYIQPHITSNAGPITEQSRSPSLSSPLVPCVSSSSSSFNTSGLENSFRHLPPPTQQHHSNTNTGPFSGISMRGNQKYSAYYQHQRKQGFQTGVINEYVNNTVGRRQRNSLSPLSTNTRYVGRRLRSGLNNTLLPVPNLEMRSPQRFPTIRNQTASTGNTMTTGNNTNNISGMTSSSSNLCSNVRGNTPYRMMSNIGNNTSSHLLNPTKPHLQTENMNNTTHGQISNNNNNNNNNNSPQQTTRHRETAFICSCGKDFESLYIFTLHMKDTGHKPKCDQAEKDIPKLVRGQDMWINSETEQTREILRCMRCHQSFRSLPELTMHMMKTNHYSEIVYNDSGRCVFVNPDDNRRGSSSGNSSTGASSHYSGNNNLSHTPGKPGLSSTSTSGGRRSHKTMNTNWSNNTQTNYSNLRLSSSEEMNSIGKYQVRPYMPTSDKYDIRKTEDIFKRSGHSDDEQNHIKSDQKSTSEEYHKLAKNENNEEILDKHQTDFRKTFNSLSSPTSSPLAISLSPSSTLCKNEEEKQQSEKSSLMNVDILDEVENKQDSELIENENNGLQQMESFVEKNHPTTSVNNTSLSIKTELSDCNFIQSTPPESVINVVERNSPPIKLSPKSHRKRTYSEAGISIKSSSYIANTTSRSYSPVSSPITMSGNELNSSNKFDSDVTDIKQVVPVISNSPNTAAKVSSTSEMSMNFSESPLSSLQKLVDTTHKPIKSTNVLNSVSSTGFTGLNPTINSNMMSCNNSSNKLSRSLGLANSTIVHSQYSPNKSGMNTCPGSPYSVHSTVSSSRLQGSPLSSPLGENDNIIPALSALYAYVERSSSTSSSQLRDTQGNLKSDLASPNNNVNKNNTSESGKNNFQFNDSDRTDDIIPDVSSPPLLNHLSTPSSTISSCNNNIVTSLLSQSSSQPLIHSQMLPPFPLPAHPLIQAIYAAAMSNLAGQCVNPQIPTSSNGSTISDPLNAFKYAAMNFKEALDSFEVSSAGLQSKVLQGQSVATTTITTTSSATATLSPMGSNGSDSQTMDFANNWLNMLRTLVESTEKFDGNNSGCNKSVNNYSESQNSSTTPERLESQQLNNFGLHSPISKSLPSCIYEQSISDSQQNISSSAQNDPVHLNYPLSINCNRSDYSYTSALPSSSSASLSSTISPMMNAPNMLQTSRLTNIPSSFHSVINRSLSSYATANNNINTSSNISSCINNTNSNNLMTTITKKAKCHFCGKPFANKGQVRLHISKNKCPCLLQQSCHVAALAAAFGSNTNNNMNTVTNNNNNARKIPQSVGTLKPSAINSYLSTATCKRSNNSATSFNITNGNNGSNNINQNLTDSVHSFTSNSARSNIKDDLTSAPSALSLLKERFQNFDANQIPTTYSNFSSYLPTNTGNLLESNLTVSSSSSVTSFTSSYNSFPYSGKASTSSMPVSSPIPNMSWLGTPNCTTFSNSQSNKDPEVMNTPGTASSAAAVNAGHLAAMALLAQTLVQLTNATQSAPTSHSSISQTTNSDNNNNTNKTNITSQKSNSSENLFDSNNTFLPFLASNLLTSRNFLNLTPDPTIQSNMPFNFNLEALLNQMNMSKQLSSLNWPTNNQTMNMDDNQSSRQHQQQK